MPALIHFHRKWLIACDDFVIPSAIETFLRTVWLIGTLTISWVEYPDCTGSTLFITYFLYGFTGHLFLTICLTFAIFFISSRGSVLQVHKRVHLPKVLYAKCVTIVLDAFFASFGVWLLMQTPNICFQWKIFIEAAVVCLYFYVFLTIIGVAVCYNSMGSSRFWKPKGDNNAAKLWKKAERIWKLRLKLFCCCADISEDKNDFIYMEISNFLTAFSKILEISNLVIFLLVINKTFNYDDIDLTPTDILAGLISLSKKHAIERRRKTMFSTSDALLVNKPIPAWMTAENALYYLKIAKSTYGWFAVYQPLQPWSLCSLLSPTRCFNGCMDSQNYSQTGDDCCYCNSSAVEKLSGFCDSDILHASFSSLIYEPAFIITIDHTKKSIIIAIRGTCSFSDLVTDIDMEEVVFPAASPEAKIKCHRGALRSALFIQKKINDLRVLKTAFMENPSYILVLTGHSLGASIAVILGMLLYPEYPTLQCYSFAPLAALSADGIVETLDFVYSVVVENDMVPRMSAYSSKKLLKEMYLSLEESQCPKYKLMMEAFWHYVKQNLKLTKTKVSRAVTAYENKEVEITDELPKQRVHHSIQSSEDHFNLHSSEAQFYSQPYDAQLSIQSNEAQLFAPGRILHLKRSRRCDFSWITGFHLQNIIISPSVIEDHQPHAIKAQLEKYKSFIENAHLKHFIEYV